MTGYFEEKEGVKSSTRLNSFILLFFLIIFDLAIIFTTNFTIDSNFILFNFVLLIGIFTPKFLHKLAENKIGKL